MKYKLIKEYPGSPKLNTVIDDEVTTFGVSFAKNNLNSIKNHSEFWQPVVEKDYEILSLVASEKNPQHEKGSKFLHNKDYKFKTMHPTEFWDIYSVKRISDNKIFTIGDLYEGLIIEKMFMSVAGDILTTYKPKQLLFTTEDGVDIFEGDKYYPVNKTYWIVNEPENTCTLNYETYHKKTNNFSTKEKAEKYIIMNKPCLSINDVLKLSTDTKYSYTFQKLEELVKSKI